MLLAEDARRRVGRRVGFRGDAVGSLDRCGDCDRGGCRGVRRVIRQPISRIGRISTLPSAAPGTRAAASIAASKSATSMR